MIAMACSVLAMAINAPTNLRWEPADLTFYWDNDPAADYATYTLDGVQRGFLYYKATSYSPDPVLLSPGNHTFCVYCADAKLNASAWSCITIFIDDTIKQELHNPPAQPDNLSWQMLDSTSVEFFWQADDSVAYFSVFLDDEMVAYHIHAHSYVFYNLSPGVHKLGVCGIDSLGYVSEQAVLTVTFNLQNQPTVLLQDAYWSFEDASWRLENQDVVTDNANAEYAYQGVSAARLQGAAGAMPYVILPAISDVQNYDSLCLSFVARGGYWSNVSKMWARMADTHRLQIGSLPYIPMATDFRQLVTPITEVQLYYANLQNFEDYGADSLLFWQAFNIPLAGAERYIALYADCLRDNYVIIDEVRVQRISASVVPTGLQSVEEAPNPNTIEQSCIMHRASKIIRDGQVLIIRGEHLYNVAGQMVK